MLNIPAQVVFTVLDGSVSMFVRNPCATHGEQKRKQTLYREPRAPDPIQALTELRGRPGLQYV